MDQATYVHARAYECVHLKSGEMRSALMFSANKMNRGEIDTLMYHYYQLKRFNHPNILKAYDFYQKKIEQSEVFIMVIEYIDSGPIINQLESMANTVREVDVISLISSILQVLDYCHDQGVLHRDLRPENLLLRKGDSFDKVKVYGFKPMKEDPRILQRRNSPRNAEEFFKGPESFPGMTGHHLADDTVK